MFEKGRYGLKEYFDNEMNTLRNFIHTPVSQAFRQVQKQLSATAFFCRAFITTETVYRETFKYQY
ncbi:hypothetical protein QY86_19135 [Salmonella enterica subsp. arizonae]|nr:hypothetical protein [Salmonella enterica subsp. arizonae]